MLDCKRLGKLRTEAKYTKTAAAKKLGISISHISEVEHGNNGISLGLLRRMVKLYGWECELRAVKRNKSGELVYTLFTDIP